MFIVIVNQPLQEDASALEVVLNAVLNPNLHSRDTLF